MRKGLLCSVLLIFAFYVFMAGIFKEFLPINTYVQPTYYGQNILTDNEALASDIIIPSKNVSPNNEDKGPTVFIKKVLAVFILRSTPSFGVNTPETIARWIISTVGSTQHSARV